MDTFLIAGSATGTVLVVMTLAFVLWSQGDVMAKLTLGQILLGVLLFSASTLAGETTGISCQVSGLVTNMGMVIFPFSVMTRYSYFFSIVVLERPVVIRHWISAVLLFWILAFVTSGLIARFDLYSTGPGIPYCMAPFHSSHPLNIVNTVLYVGLMILGGVAHSVASFCILRKSDVKQDPKKTCHHRNRNAILQKFIPVAVIYQATHIPFMVFAAVQLATHQPFAESPNQIYAHMYAFSTILTPITILLTNRNLYSPRELK